ncbi:MAG: transporter substrate-binding domain-containing protein [Proteobacteria bacterium]|nr:transporter substrate-binding domain-containing protein [Pseudomonadota bacterium]
MQSYHLILCLFGIILTVGCKPKGVPSSRALTDQGNHQSSGNLQQQSLALDGTGQCKVKVINIAKDDYRYSFYDRLMRLALSKSDEAQGSCSYEALDQMSHTRKFNLLARGQLDIAGNVTSTAIERDAEPVRIPVHMGLHGFRLLVIRKGDEARFAGVKTNDDLAAFRGGVVQGWQVADVLAENGLKSVSNDEYEALFRMLQKGRIDYIPLALFEVYLEVAKRPQYDLTVEPTILLQYPSTDYFFVNAARPALRQRLTNGLVAAIADGSRDSLMESFLSLSEFVKRAELSSRTSIHLSNSVDPANAPRDIAKYWFSFDNFPQNKG